MIDFTTESSCICLDHCTYLYLLLKLKKNVTINIQSSIFFLTLSLFFLRNRKLVHYFYIAEIVHYSKLISFFRLVRKEFLPLLSPWLLVAWQLRDHEYGYCDKTIELNGRSKNNGTDLARVSFPFLFDCPLLSAIRRFVYRDLSERSLRRTI